MDTYKDQKQLVVHSMLSILKKISLYSLKHTSVKSAISEAYKYITSLLKKNNELTIASSDQNILIDGALPDENSQTLEEINDFFDRLSIESITFSNGLSLKEFEFLFKILTAKKESIEKKGGTIEILSKVGAKHLKVNQYKYEKIADDKFAEDEEKIYEISNDSDKVFTIDNKYVDKVNEEAEKFQDLLKNEITKLAGSGEEMERIYNFLIEKFNDELEDRVNQETKELKVKNKKISFEKNRTESEIKSISDGLVVVDNTGNVLMMNPAAEMMFSKSDDKIVGSSLMDNARDELMVSLSKDTFKEDESDDSFIKEIEIEGNEDTQKTIRSSTAVVENEDGKTVGMVSILTDVTKQKEIENMKAAFTSNVSHELRTPLAAIKQTVSLLLLGTTGPINEMQNKFLVIAKKSLERLGRLIDDLLDLSKLEAGKMDINLQMSNIITVVDDTISTLNHWADSKKISLNKDINIKIPDFLFDADRIMQILVNLTSNAIKFTSTNGVVTISAKLTKSLDGITGDMLEISVKDDGPGIAKQNLDKVFEKFKQVGGNKITDIKGTGLGLPIAKEIVTLHNGKIRVESEEGLGSNFIFTIPLIQTKTKTKI